MPSREIGLAMMTISEEIRNHDRALRQSGCEINENDQWVDDTNTVIQTGHLMWQHVRMFNNLRTAITHLKKADAEMDELIRFQEGRG